MRKTLAILFAVAMIAALCVIPTGAAYDKKATPEWIITEFCQDNQHNRFWEKGTVGAGGDCFEFIEVVNTSGKTLSLYDFSIVYNGGYDETLDKFTNITAGAVSTSLVDTTRTPENPKTANVASGEVAVLWMWNFDSYGAMATVADFKAHYGLDEDVAVYVVDADNSGGTGNGLRFNCKNSAYATYGIGVKDFTLGGGYDELICWSTQSFNYSDRDKFTPARASKADLTSNYLLNVKAADVRCMDLESYMSYPSPGALTAKQTAAVNAALGK